MKRNNLQTGQPQRGQMKSFSIGMATRDDGSGSPHGGQQSIGLGHGDSNCSPMRGST